MSELYLPRFSMPQNGYDFQVPIHIDHVDDGVIAIGAIPADAGTWYRITVYNPDTAIAMHEFQYFAVSSLPFDTGAKQRGKPYVYCPKTGDAGVSHTPLYPQAERLVPECDVNPLFEHQPLNSRDCGDPWYLRASIHFPALYFRHVHATECDEGRCSMIVLRCNKIAEIYRISILDPTSNTLREFRYRNIRDQSFYTGTHLDGRALQWLNANEDDAKDTAVRLVPAKGAIQMVDHTA